MRKICVSLVLITLLLINSMTAFASAEKPLINLENKDQGFVGINYLNNSERKIKLIIQKDEQKYIYDLLANGDEEIFPLQMGNGIYNIYILENTQGTSYKYIFRQNTEVNMKDLNSVYLNSIQNIRWDKDMECIKTAAEIVKNKKTDDEKIKAIYEHIINTISYDYEKLEKLKSGYIPDIEETNASLKGVCYDYASLFAAMLRSSGIPAKLVKGYTKNINGYHAWNEVYLSETQKWITIDTTCDSILKGKDKAKMIKDNALYEKHREY